MRTSAILLGGMLFSLTAMTGVELFAQEAGNAAPESQPSAEKPVQQPEDAAKTAANLQALAQRIKTYRNAGWVLEEERPAEGRERLLLLLSGGPLVVELKLSIDGAPYDASREAMIDELIAWADADGDGSCTWEEIIAAGKQVGNPYYGRLRGVTSAAPFDTDLNGLADRLELRLVLAQSYSGPALLVQRSFAASSEVVWGLLDADNDKTISPAELEAAAARLKSRDQDDNDILARLEISSTPYGRNASPHTQLFPLTGSTDWSYLETVLKSQYGAPLAREHCRLVPALFDALDENGDGTVSAEELPRLQKVDPQLVTEVAFGKTEEPLRLTHLAEELKTEENPDPQLLKLATDHLAIVRLEAAAGGQYITQQVESYFTRFDGDKNNYLDEKEMEQQAGLKQYFAQWDADSDGKLYREEMQQMLEKSQLPMLNKIILGATSAGDPLWDLLDSDSSGMLGLRELQSAAKNLSAADANGDGELKREEIPPTFRLFVGRGNQSYQAMFNPGLGMARTAPSQTAPKWFAHMDANADGDISPREFLGSSEQFQRLDKNQDGLIDAEEAE